MLMLDKFKDIADSDSSGCWNYIGIMHQKCLHHFQDICRTVKDNDSSEFNLLFMELHNILKDVSATMIMSSYSEMRRQMTRKITSYKKNYHHDQKHHQFLESVQLSNLLSAVAIIYS